MDSNTSKPQESAEKAQAGPGKSKFSTAAKSARVAKWLVPTPPRPMAPVDIEMPVVEEPVSTVRGLDVAVQQVPKSTPMPLNDCPVVEVERSSGSTSVIQSLKTLKKNLSKLGSSLKKPKKGEETAHLNYEDFESQTPWFTILWTLLDVAIFFGYVIREREFSSTRPLAGPGSWQYKLVDTYPGCDDVRYEFWRYWLYQFCHKGGVHIFSNAVMQILYGSTLEMVHGSFRTFFVYNTGVIAGALTCATVDVYRTVVGASGGIYTLFGMHFANLMLNMDVMQDGLFIRCLCLFGLMGADIVGFLFFKSSSSSYAAHAGGWFWGNIMGVIVLKNIKRSKKEWMLAWACLLVAVFFLLFCTSWLADHWMPTNWADEKTYGAAQNPRCCWLDIEPNTTRADYQCLRHCTSADDGAKKECEYSLRPY